MRFDSSELGLLILTDANLTPATVLDRGAFAQYLDSVIDPIHEFWDPAKFPEGNKLREGLADPKFASSVIDDCRGRD